MGFAERAGSRSFPSEARASMSLAIGRLCAIMSVTDSLQVGSAGTVLKEPVTLVRERERAAIPKRKQAMTKTLNVAIVGYGFASKTFHAPLIVGVPGL